MSRRKGARHSARITRILPRSQAAETDRSALLSVPGPLLAVFPSDERQLVRVYDGVSEVRDDLQDYWMQLRGPAFVLVMIVLRETCGRQQMWAELRLTDFLHKINMRSYTQVWHALTIAQERHTILVEEVPGQPWKRRYALDFSCISD